MRGRVDAAITLPRSQMPAGVAERIVRAISVPNPAARSFRRRRRFNSEPDRLYLVEETPTTLRIPRGAVDEVRRALAPYRIPLVFDDHRVLPAARLPVEATPLLRDYQHEAVDLFAQATQGVLVLPTGAGKTRVVMGVVAKLATPTLVLLQSTDLAAQWKTEFASTLGLDAGVIGDGESDVRPVTVALVQALVRWSDVEREALLRRFGLVVVDEAHHVASLQLRSMVDRCPAKYRLGITATPEREDGLSPALRFYLGPELMRVPHDELVEQRVLVRPSVRVLETEFDFPYTGPEDLHALLAALAADEPRARAIAAAIAAEVAGGHVCLVLAGRRDYCATLASELAKLGVATEVLTSRVSRKKRGGVLERARRGEVPVLIATSLADEGLDVPRLSRVFLAWPGKARGRTLQRIGRVMRPHASKDDAVVIDVVDRLVLPLARQASRRASIYRRVLGVRPATSHGRGA